MCKKIFENAPDDVLKYALKKQISKKGGIMESNYSMNVKEEDLKNISEIVKISNARLAGNGVNILPIPYSAPKRSFFYRIFVRIIDMLFVS